MNVFKLDYKKASLAIVLCLSITMAACSTSWVSTLDTIVSVAAPALVNILEIVAAVKGVPVNATLAAKVTADAASIKALATSFASASTSAAPGICAQLQAAIATYQADQNQILQLAQVSDPATQTKINLLSGLVATTVTAILAVIPSCQSSNVSAKLKESPVNVKSFVKTYNAILVTKTGNAAVDSKTASLKLHEHSKFTRVITAGLLN